MGGWVDRQRDRVGLDCFITHDLSIYFSVLIRSVLIITSGGWVAKFRS